MSEEIKDNFDDVEVELVEGARGEFSVIHQDDPPALIHSSVDCAKLPSYGDITSKLVKYYGCGNRKTRQGL